jgi:hypothetical protein
VSYVPILTTWLPSKVQSDEMLDSVAAPDMGEPMGGEDLKDEDFGLTGDDLDKLKDGGAADGGAADGGSAAATPDGGTAAAPAAKEAPPEEAKPLTKAEKAKAKREAAKAEREAKRAAKKAKATAPAE